MSFGNFNAPEFGIRMKYPAGWHIKTETTDFPKILFCADELPEDFQFEDALSNKKLTFLLLCITPVSGHLSFDEFIQLPLKQMEMCSRDLETSDIILGGEKGKIAEHTPADIPMLEAWTMREQHAYIFSFNASSVGRYRKHLATIKQSIESLQFIQPTKDHANWLRRRPLHSLGFIDARSSRDNFVYRCPRDWKVLRRQQNQQQSQQQLVAPTVLVWQWQYTPPKDTVSFTFTLSVDELWAEAAEEKLEEVLSANSSGGYGRVLLAQLERKYQRKVTELPEFRTQTSVLGGQPALFVFFVAPTAAREKHFLLATSRGRKAYSLSLRSTCDVDDHRDLGLFFRLSQLFFFVDSGHRSAFSTGYDNLQGRFTFDYHPDVFLLMENGGVVSLQLKNSSSANFFPTQITFMTHKGAKSLVDLKKELSNEAKQSGGANIEEKDIAMMGTTGFELTCNILLPNMQTAKTVQRVAIVDNVAYIFTVATLETKDLVKAEDVFKTLKPIKLVSDWSEIPRV